MKTILALIVALVSIHSAQAAPGDSVRVHLSNVLDRVRNCSILPYDFRDGVKVYHELYSHCPEVKVTAAGKAKIKVDAHIFLVSLEEAPDCDGDFYNVLIQDKASGEVLKLLNVAAYGDVLLGVLGGQTDGVTQVPVMNGFTSDLDAYLLKKVY